MSDSTIDATRQGIPCSYACGRVSDMVVTAIADSTTEFLCMPCFTSLAVNVMQAMTEPDSPDVIAAVEAAGDVDYVPNMVFGMEEPMGGGPPVDSMDDVLDGYSSVVMFDDGTGE